MGEEGPEKFFSDGKFCIWSQLLFVATALTLSCLASKADHGGNSDIPFFMTGFILSLLHIVNLSMKIYVLYIIKTVSKTAILEVLRNTISGRYLWPISAFIGMVYVIPGMILTGLGGLNCDVDNQTNSKNDTESPRNDCYYSIYDQNANLYKGLAIGLMVIHGLSLVWFFFSGFPEKGVLDSIRDNPKPTPEPPKQTDESSTPSSPNNPLETVADTQAPQDGASGSTSQPEQLSAKQLAQRQKEIEMKELVLALQARTQQLDERTRELERRERELQKGFVDIPPPPSYETLTRVSVHEAPFDNRTQFDNR